MEEHTIEEQKISKKAAAIEVLSVIKDYKILAVSNAVTLFIVIGFAPVSTIAASVLAGIMIVYDLFIFGKNKSYEKYLKEKYKL